MFVTTMYQVSTRSVDSLTLSVVSGHILKFISLLSSYPDQSVRVCRSSMRSLVKRDPSRPNDTTKIPRQLQFLKKTNERLPAG